MSTAGAAGTVTGARSTRLGARTRKAVLITHIAASGAWLGLAVAMGVLVSVAATTDDVLTRAAAFQLVGTVGVWPVLGAGLVALSSGVLLGLGTKWGVFRYWWVLVKLVLTVVLLILVLIALRPEAAELAERGRALATGEAVALTVGDLAFPPVVSTTALLFAMVLSVVKPWRRIRGGR